MIHVDHRKVGEKVHSLKTCSQVSKVKVQLLHLVYGLFIMRLHTPKDRGVDYLTAL